MIQIYKKIFLLSHVIVFLFCIASIAETKTLKPWTGKVVGISDGDTISILDLNGLPDAEIDHKRVNRLKTN